MKKIVNVVARCAAIAVFIACFVPVASTGQSLALTDAADTLQCSRGIWTPAPVQHAESGGPSDPAFHTIYGLSCGGNVYMVRFSNKINDGKIVVDMLGKIPIGCSGGTWTPTPIQHTESGGAGNPAFHTVWGLACGAKVFMVRFSNKISGDHIAVDIIGQTSAN